MTDYSATPAEMEIILSHGAGDYLTEQTHDESGTYLTFVKGEQTITVMRNETVIGAHIGLFEVSDEPGTCYRIGKPAVEVNQIICEKLGL
ncbi:MAG: hypothetical protein WC455_28465 [Dehalococcoidia bacterium]|jgi:hypothetical protein